MTRIFTLATVTAAALATTSGAALAREPNHADYITVSAPSEQVIGHAPGTNAPILLHIATVNVNVGDLDPRTEPGWHELAQRLRIASRMACDVLDRKIYPRSRSGAHQCRSQATHEAMRAALPLRTAFHKVDSFAFTIGR